MNQKAKNIVLTILMLFLLFYPKVLPYRFFFFSEKYAICEETEPNYDIIPCHDGGFDNGNG